jgi:hypothetical protein
MLWLLRHRTYGNGGGVGDDGCQKADRRYCGRDIRSRRRRPSAVRLGLHFFLQLLIAQVLHTRQHPHRRLLPRFVLHHCRFHISTITRLLVRGVHLTLCHDRRVTESSRFSVSVCRRRSGLRFSARPVSTLCQRSRCLCMSMEGRSQTAAWL